MRCKPLLVLAMFTFLSFHLVLIGCGATGGSSASNLSTPPASNPGSPGASSAQPGSGSAGGGSGSSGTSSGGSNSGGSNASGGGSTSGGGSSGSGGSGSTGGIAQGGFTETKFPIPAAGQMLAADFNHDGRPDLLIYGSALSVSLNNGAGNFSAPIPVRLPASYSLVSQVALEDFNADGYTDVAACVNSADGASGAAAVFLNDHSGKLILSQVIPAPAACKGIATGDANHDGKADFAFSYYTGSFSAPVNAIATWFGDGAGHFANPVTQSNVTLTATDNTMNPCSILASTGADFDGDGNLDLLLFGTCQSYVINPGDIYLARGDGTGHYSLSEISESSISVYGTPYVKDINSDGKPDVVFMEAQYGPHASSDMQILFAINNGSAGMGITPVTDENAYASSGGYIRAGSPLSGTGTAIEGFLLMPCCASASYGVKLVTEGKSDAAHTWIYGQSNGASLPGEITGIASADFDGNGTQDFAVAEQDANKNSTLHVYLNSSR